MAYWEPWHSQNSLFRYFQAYSGIFNNIQPNSDKLRHIKTHSGIFRHSWCGWSHNQTCSEFCVTLAFTAVSYLEPWLIFLRSFSKACQKCQAKSVKLKLRANVKPVKLRLKLFHSTLNFEQKEPDFLASQCTSFLLRTKPIQRNYRHFFKDFKQKSALCRLMPLRLLVKNFLMQIISEVKVIMSIATTRKPCFEYFSKYTYI